MDLNVLLDRLTKEHNSLATIIQHDVLSPLKEIIFDLGASIKASEKAMVPLPSRIGGAQVCVRSATLISMAAPYYSPDGAANWNAETDDGEKIALAVIGTTGGLSAGYRLIAHRLYDGRWVSLSV